jgi:hypothetical protein
MDILTGITANSPNRVVIGAGKVLVDFVDGAGGGAERTLGMTKGGNTFEVIVEFLDLDVDGTYGKPKGLDYIVGLEARLTANLAEILTTANLLLTIGGLESNDRTWTQVVGEHLGTGAETDSGVAPAGATDIDATTLQVYRTPAGGGLPVLLTITTDYTVHATTQVVTTTVAGAVLDTDEVTAAYSYDSSGSSDDFDILTLNELDDSDYRNWALVGRPTNASYTKPIYWVIKNGLSVGGLNINLQKKQGAVVGLTIEARWANTDQSLDNAPFEIWNPQT